MTEKSSSTILVVDDQPGNLKVLLSFLKGHSFKIHVANSGARALKAVQSAPKPDLILLDVMMPGMNGFETCMKIKEDRELSDIPIIFITALDSVEDKVAGFKAGGVDYITKPFQQIEVLARINTHLALRKKEMELQLALAEVRQLKGIIPICCKCKQIRDDKGYWQQVEDYISKYSDAQFSHGYCPACYEKELDMLADMATQAKKT